MDVPRDNLIRARHTSAAATIRADEPDGDTGDDGRTMFGHFAVFDQWTEIDSWYEGRFLERLAPGAFADTLSERAESVRVLYDHGTDPAIGNKPLGAPDVLREDKEGVYYESELFDADYVNQLLPALRAGQLGASFRFGVVAESWSDPKRATNHNPAKLPERTIEAVDLYEFGPVTFPAYEAASAGLRSGTDSFIDRLLHDPTFVARFTERAGLKVVEQVLAGVPADGQPPAPAPEATDGPSRSDTDEVSTTPYTPAQKPRRTREQLEADRLHVAAITAAASARNSTHV